MRLSTNHTNSGVANNWVKWPKNQRMPSALSRERMAMLGITAVSTHDSNTSTAHSTQSTKAIRGRLFFIGTQVVDVKDTKFQRAHHQTGGVDAHTAIALWKKFLDEFILPLLKALDSERHTT